MEQEAGLGPKSRAILEPDFKLVVQNGADRLRGKLPTVQEFTIVIPDVSESYSWDIILFKKNSDGTFAAKSEYIHREHPAYLLLRYMLFYQYGNLGYHCNIPLVRRNNVIGNGDEYEEYGAPNKCILAVQYYRYHLCSQKKSPSSPDLFKAPIHGERLAQQILCDMYACMDINVLNWHKMNQDVILSEIYKGVIDALHFNELLRKIG